jgi:hypothetical protein
VARWLLLFALLLTACGNATTATSSEPEQDTSATSYPPPPASLELSPTSCPAASLHVYRPQRLRLLAGCRELSLSGVIKAERAEADGDYHLLLKVDPGQRDPNGGGFINTENVRQQGGALVLEPVCEHAVTQSSALAACQGYRNLLKIPATSSHVIASGYWVYDSGHGWQEVHPLTGLQKLP